MSFEDHPHKERARQIAKDFILTNTRKIEEGKPICLLSNGCVHSFPTFERKILEKSPAGSINISYDLDKKTFPLNRDKSPRKTYVFNKNIFDQDGLEVPDWHWSHFTKDFEPHCTYYDRKNHFIVDAAWVDAMSIRSAVLAENMAELLSKSCPREKYIRPIALSTLRQRSPLSETEFERQLIQELETRGLKYEPWGWNKVRGAGGSTRLDLFLFTVENNVPPSKIR